MDNNKSVVLCKNGIFSLDSSPIPSPKSDEVIIKVAACGICSSDIQRAFMHGAYHYPLVMGHEFSGEVINIGDNVEPTLLGKNVVVFPLIPCFKCRPCQNEIYSQCSSYKYYGSRNNGGFTKFIAVNNWNILALPNGVSLLDGSLTEPSAVVLHGLRRIGLIDGNKSFRVLILGAGFLGILAAEILSILRSDIKITIADRNKYKLDLISDKVSEVILLDRTEDLQRFSQEQSGTFDSVIEVTGSPDIFRESIQLVCPGGSILWMSNIESDLLIPKSIMSKILRKEITIYGTWNSSFSKDKMNDWSRIIYLMSNGFKPSKYVSDIVDLKNVPDVLFNLYNHKSSMNKNKILKALILPQNE